MFDVARVPSDSAGSHLRKSTQRIIDDDRKDYVPVHWMGSNRVQMTMVRRDSFRRLQSSASRTTKKGKALADAKVRERQKWRRLVEQGEQLVVETDEMQGEYTPDPMSDVDCRSRMLSSLQPPQLHRLDARISEHKNAASSPSRLPEVPEEHSDGGEDSEEASGRTSLSRQHHEQNEKRQAKMAAKATTIERQPSAAATMVATLYEGESVKLGKTAMCPFSGQLVSLDELPGHMDQWRSLMRAELTSLQHDTTYGPRVGLFVVPIVPEDYPTSDSSPEELQQWSDRSLAMYKTGYVMVKPEHKKYHWTELRKVLEVPQAPHRPWERNAEEIEEERKRKQAFQAALRGEDPDEERSVGEEEYQARTSSKSPLRTNQLEPFYHANE